MSILRLRQSHRMSQASVAAGLVALSGQVSTQGTTVTEQTRDILATIDALLSAAGSDKTKILYATIWLADMSTYDSFNAVWDTWITPGQAPSRACVQAQLVKPEWLVEVQVLAAA